ncbi:hypothetical protein L1987_79039 [Smallanthus sonchifolius]|uniref:Uncharacterized protein n=1 Tax=Smallanthus sonchifolius TaxID=185202 RepID=A0ACB8ZFD4_9ASTR|nr:hypothetical protein L1987_79039 [Smallanthus sonchifolius]
MLWQRHNSSIPTNWPVIGAIAAVVFNVHRLLEYATDVLALTGGTFMLKGPWLAKMDMLLTSSPADIHYILSKNFRNYPKGDKFREIFDILGEGVSNIDGSIWKFHRRTLMHLLNHPSFLSLVKMIVWNKVEKGLLPVLDKFSTQGAEVDLQDIFQRFAFDIICESVFDYDAQSMSLDLPYIPCDKALSHAEEAIFCRHIMPEILWKLLRVLRIGSEKKLRDARKDIDQFVYKRIAEKEKDLCNMNYELKDEKFNFLTSLMREYSLLVYYLVAKNPIAEEKIREELVTQLNKEMGWKCNDLRAIELSNLVYLHGGLCEALRLYPAVPFQHNAPVQPDMLPSGYQVDRNTSLILCFYVMGRMESVWGKDCLKFKPERWFATGGGIEHQPSYKFHAFNAGPRTCLGKQMSFTQMKIVAATIIYHYHVELVKGHPILPSNSVILEIKNGLKVRLVPPNIPSSHVAFVILSVFTLGATDQTNISLALLVLLLSLQLSDSGVNSSTSLTSITSADTGV